MAETDVVEIETTAEVETPVEETATVADSAEIARLKAELAKNKTALDKATKEAGEYKKQLRANKSAEEQRAEEEEERRKAIDEELKTLRKEAAVSKISKSVMAFIGSEETANKVAEALYGAEDIEAAIDAFGKAWAAKEKQMRIEFGKIPAPDAGDGAPTTTKQELANMSYLERLNFAKKYPDTYEKLTK